MGNNEKVLIVDDEPDFIEAFRRTLEAKSYQVITASSKEQAQEMVSVAPDILVVGTMSPAGQSFALYKWLKQHKTYQNTPILIIDACPEERLDKGWRRFEGIQIESDGYISKPVEPSALVPVIQSLLEQATMPKRIRVMVIDDHTMIRESVCAVLALQEDMEVVGEAVNGLDALDKMPRLLPNVALMDIVMPVMSGLEATKHISKKYPQTKVLILTQFDEEENMLLAKQAGAHGFIPKRAASTELINGIRAVSSGKYFHWSLA